MSKKVWLTSAVRGVNFFKIIFIKNIISMNQINQRHAKLKQ